MRETKSVYEAVCELQAMGFVRVMVADEDYNQAKQIISEWEVIQLLEACRPEERTTVGIQLFFAGAIQADRILSAAYHTSIHLR